MKTLALILTLLGPRPDAAGVGRLAPVFEAEAQREGVDPRLVVAVAFRESSLRARAVGDAGELGIMQIKPGGQARWRCRGLRWRTRVRDNIRCGVRILAFARRQCPGRGPRAWLRIYNGTRGCGPSRYARRVLRILKRAGGNPRAAWVGHSLHRRPGLITRGAWCANRCGVP